MSDRCPRHSINGKAIDSSNGEKTGRWMAIFNREANESSSSSDRVLDDINDTISERRWTTPSWDNGGSVIVLLISCWMR
jgi:hypothetical protein